MEFKELFKKYSGKDIIVLGCGTSVTDFVDKIPKDAITIGVNDIGDIFTPTYLLVVNSPESFNPVSRKETILNNKSPYMITHLAKKWKGVKNEIYTIELGNAKLSNVGKIPTNVIDYHNNSPYMACICAYYLGARRIGLIGVDFTNNHFNNNDGAHKLQQNLEAINNMFAKLEKKLRSYGCELYNISPISRVDSIPRMNQDDFIAEMINNEKRN